MTVNVTEYGIQESVYHRIKAEWIVWNSLGKSELNKQCKFSRGGREERKLGFTAAVA